MAEHPNVVAVRRGYKSFAAGNVGPLEAMVADDVVWHVPGAHRLSGDYSGKLAVFGFLANLPPLLRSIAIDVHDVVGNADHVVALLNQKVVAPDGRELAWRAVQVFDFDSDGRIRHVWTHNESQAELDALVGGSYGEGSVCGC